MHLHSRKEDTEDEHNDDGDTTLVSGLRDWTHVVKCKQPATQPPDLEQFIAVTHSVNTDHAFREEVYVASTRFVNYQAAVNIPSHQHDGSTRVQRGNVNGSRYCCIADSNTKRSFLISTCAH